MAAVLGHQFDSRRHDLVAVDFDGNDKLLHLFWRYVVPQPGAGLPGRSRRSAACLAYYRELDGHLARAVAAPGPTRGCSWCPTMASGRARTWST